MATSNLLSFDNPNAQSGTPIHFANLQAEDLYLVGPVVTRRGLLNRQVNRIFEQKYRTVSVFAQEQIYNEITTIGIGQTGKVQLFLTGDLLYSIALVCVFPDYALNNQILDAVNFNGDLTRYTHANFGYVTNLGPCMTDNIIFNIESTAIDQQLSTQSIIVNNLMRRKDQREYYNDLIGNTLERCKLESSKAAFKTMTPIQLFFADSPQKTFQYLRAGQPNIYMYTKLKPIDQLICKTRNLIANDFATPIKATKLGYVAQEIYLSEQERIIHVNVGTTSLIEQNIWFSGTFATSVGQQFQPNQFTHPCKWLMYGVQKAKYQQALPYLSYQPVIEGIQNDSDLLNDATTRFVLKFASYTALIDYAGVASYTAQSPAVLLTGATSAIPSGILDDPVYLPYSNSNVLLTFTQDSNGVIKSCFEGSTIAAEQNATAWSIDSAFQRIQPWALQGDGIQRYMKTGSIVPQNGLLTLNEASKSIDAELKNHLPATVNFVAKTPLSASVGRFAFSLYSSGAITITYGSTNQFTGTVASTAVGSNLFSNIIKDPKFNYGLDNFDTLVTQWDNFGKYINGTGDLLQTCEVLIGSQQRFKVSGFYSQRVHQMKFFPGKTPKGVHVQSFALDPFSLQPCGTLNFTRSQVKINVDADIDVNDLFFMSLVVYNVMELREGVSQVLYSTTFQ